MPVIERAWHVDRRPQHCSTSILKVSRGMLVSSIHVFRCVFCDCQFCCISIAWAAGFSASFVGCAHHQLLMMIRTQLITFRTDAINHSSRGGSFPNRFMQVPGVGDHLRLFTLPQESAKYWKIVSGILLQDRLELLCL